MPKQDASDQEWFRSLEFYKSPHAELLFAVIVQAIDDAATEIRDPPLMPKYAPKHPGDDASEKDFEVYSTAKKLFDRRCRTISGKIRAIRERKDNQAQARSWLMADESNFPEIADKLGIDADIIREAITSEYQWARARRWENTRYK